ncbi:MAG TPA: hypothetical protein VJR89_13115 [Polyangiales bacterium]|nr:hypothetical protein [Polyangiales bacterium]
MEDELPFLTGDAAAQTFTLSAAGTLVEIRLGTLCNDLRAYLARVNSDGTPSAMQLASLEEYTGAFSRMPLDAPPDSYFYALVSNPPLQVRNGDVLAIVLEATDKTSGFACLGYSMTDLYPGGAMYSKFAGSAAWSPKPGDLAFQVLLDAP